ncbi:hypothetical protein COLO4_33969 [Corchorus olitorius]|uniref:Uncharacterized protein n=1 Tax=Corchorus olitorius TaxID=93759 RepID=A0A1R3GPU4_9ROSI|nr:hypothetical protein COLO4_33969 [Corchorus olitorius]
MVGSALPIPSDTPSLTPQAVLDRGLWKKRNVAATQEKVFLEVEVELGTKDGIESLEFVNGCFEKRKMRGIREEEGQDSDVGAAGYGHGSAYTRTRQ